MPWLTEFQTAQPIAWSILVLATVALAGLSLGHVAVRGIRLGVAGVLFSGILFGHLRLTLAPDLLALIRDLGLIIFVYTIGLQVGPGFFSSLRRNGLRLNLLALAIVVTGAVITVVGARALHIEMPAAVGIFSGATTNTPSLGAAQEAMRHAAHHQPAHAGSASPAMGYAAAYPFGIIGIVLTMVGLRSAWRIRLDTELRAFQQEEQAKHLPLARMNIRVSNRNLDGLRVREIPGREALGVVISRIRKVGAAHVSVANDQTELHTGDILLAVGTPAHLHDFCLIVGEECAVDLMEDTGPVTFDRFVLTSKELLGKTIGELQLTDRYGVAVTRVLRSEVEVTAAPNLTLQFGDVLTVVGKKPDIDAVAALVGNSVNELNRTNFITFFLGITLGILLGLVPISLPGMPMPLRLGLAGGPLVAALLLSRLGRIGRLVWYMPPNANLALREFGITLFLACAGLKAGEHFAEVVFTSQGPLWLLLGALVTLVPLGIVGTIARAALKLNFMSVCGLLAGSMTDPPALAFANTINKSDAPSIAYASVYPFTMLLRIVAAQALVIWFCT